MQLLISYIIGKYRPYVVDLTKFYMGDENKWSILQGAHFEQEYHHEAFEVICHIIREKPEQRVWSNPHFFRHKYDGDQRALDVESAFHLMDELVEKEDVLWMNILEKLYRRIPDDARVREYVAVCKEEMA